MTFKEVVKRFKNDSWWSEESPGNFQQAITAWRAFVLHGNIYGRPYLSLGLFLYKNDFLYEQTPASEKLKEFYEILDLYIKNPKRILNDYWNFIKARKKFIDFGEKLILKMPRMSNVQLASAYKKYYVLHINFFAIR